MTDPIIKFQTAIRLQLLDTGPVTDLVEPVHIRSGPTRPDRFPSIILASPQSINLGRDASGAFLTKVSIDLHIWAIEDGAELAQVIGGRVATALWDDPLCHTSDVSDYERPSFRFMRDPDPERSYRHGVATVTGVVRWRE